MRKNKMFAAIIVISFSLLLYLASFSTMMTEESVSLRHWCRIHLALTTFMRANESRLLFRSDKTRFSRCVRAMGISVPSILDFWSARIWISWLYR